MSQLPAGWDDRRNTMSEKDIQLGGAAAARFAVSGVYGESATYKTSDQVRAHYYNNMSQDDTNSGESLLPSGWEQRQKKLETEAKQHGAFARKGDVVAANKQETTIADAGVAVVRDEKNVGAAAASHQPETALVQVATYSLEALARTLEVSSSAKIPLQERAAFADAARRAMNALAKSS